MVGWHHWLNGHEFEWWRTEEPGALQSMGSIYVHLESALLSQIINSL